MLWSEMERFGKFIDPWREFARMRPSYARTSTPSSTEFPLVNVWTSAERATVTTEIPGVEPKAIYMSAPI